MESWGGFLEMQAAEPFRVLDLTSFKSIKTSCKKNITCNAPIDKLRDVDYEEGEMQINSVGCNRV